MKYILYLYNIIYRNGNLTAVPVKNIVTKVVCLDIRAEDQLIYQSQLPNHIEKD